MRYPIEVGTPEIILKEYHMLWKKPIAIETCLALEINGYALINTQNTQTQIVNPVSLIEQPEKNELRVETPESEPQPACS